jgi:DNA-binding NarL/FixJ family response regulator
MPAQYPIQLVVVDERPIVRAGIAACLHDAPDLRIEGDFATLAQCVAVGQELHPDVVLIGYQRRGSLSGAIRELRQVHPAVRVVVLSRCGGGARARMAIEAGAEGFMRQSTSAADLAEGLRVVARGQRFLDNATTMDMANRSGDDDLGPREIEVLRRVAAGLANKQIAHEMSTTEGTVKNHMKRILAKLGAADRTHAVVIAVRRGFISLNP